MFVFKIKVKDNNYYIMIYWYLNMHTQISMYVCISHKIQNKYRYLLNKVHCCLHTVLHLFQEHDICKPKTHWKSHIGSNLKKWNVENLSHMPHYLGLRMWKWNLVCNNCMHMIKAKKMQQQWPFISLVEEENQTVRVF